jgi:hypothetical protein
MKTNRDFYRDIRGSATTYYLADLHVHTPASLDVSKGDRLAALPEECRNALEAVTRRGLSALNHERAVRDAYPPAKFLEDIVKARDRIAQANAIGEGLDWAFIGLADHNVCAYSCGVARLAWDERSRNRVHILPGIELDIRYPVGVEGEALAHVLCLFRPGLSESDIRVAIHDASGRGWEPGTELGVESLPAVIRKVRNHHSYPAICVAAHVATQKGVREETRMAILSRLDAELARVQQELEHGADPDRAALTVRLEELQGQRTANDEISLSCLKLIGDCGFDALQVASEQDQVHYRYLHRYKPDFGRAVPIIASDAHCADDIFRCYNGIPYLKLTSASSRMNEDEVFEDVRDALRLGETRFSFTTPGAVQYWISGFEVTPDSDEAARFWPYSRNSGSNASFFLPLSRNLNAFVGGRGAGKSAAIEALSFICRPDEYATADRKNPPDWYTRAEATLAGCNVRICLQFLGDERAADLPKKALFARRHFSKSGDYEPVHFSDLSDRELLPNQIPARSVQIFRLGQIEQHAGANRLRALFDAICGPEVRRIEEDIRQEKEALLRQRRGMAALAERLASLTSTDAPLRDYLHRWELLAAVDRPEVKEAYERIDELEKAQKTAASAKSDWEKIEIAFDLDAKVADAKGFFAKYRPAAIADTGDPLPDHEALLEIVGMDTATAEGPGGRLHGIMEAADTLGTRLKSIGIDLSAFHARIDADMREARDALQQRGLPTGGKDREAKKRALEEAQDALTQCRELLSQWHDAESTRREMVQELRVLANKRSELRDRTARLITDRLRRDLDSDILVIEANARTQSDTHEFRDWLDTHFSDPAFRYRDKRITALLNKGLTPADLRALLSDVSPSDYSLLEVPGSASRGGIDTTNAKSLYEKCAAISHLSPEKQESEVEERLWTECPQEIRDGLLEFTRDANGDLCVDYVLELDEILFDDEPVILLNDRPQDADSILRPLEELSPGQRCSAILPILLLTGEGPLIIDQPEDNLDNRLIRQVIVNILASIKLRRQVIVATHNPNVPVLGDVENAVVLRGVRDRECVVDATGDLDAGEVVHQLTQVMEGGREAFQYRQTIYQLHWTESVAQNEVEASSGDIGTEREGASDR